LLDLELGQRLANLVRKSFLKQDREGQVNVGDAVGTCYDYYREVRVGNSTKCVESFQFNRVFVPTFGEVFAFDLNAIFRFPLKESRKTISRFVERLNFAKDRVWNLLSYFNFVLKLIDTTSWQHFILRECNIFAWGADNI